MGPIYNCVDIELFRCLVVFAELEIDQEAKSQGVPIQLKIRCQ
jgi:hypothetical protein